MIVILKKYIAGFTAILLSMILLSFNSFSKTYMNGLTNNYVFDVCAERDKLFFLISLPCNSQMTNGQLDPSIIRNPLNYQIFGDGSKPPDSEICPGSTCLCMIKACPTGKGSARKPIINTVSEIYYQIGSYSNSGNPSGFNITEKN